MHSKLLNTCGLSMPYACRTIGINALHVRERESAEGEDVIREEPRLFFFLSCDSEKCITTIRVALLMFVKCACFVLA